MQTPVLDRPQAQSYARRTLTVLKAWLRKPGQVATICPSSSHLTREITERACVQNARTLIELGPGAGGTTWALLSQMQRRSRLLAIEKTLELADSLRHIRDPRLTHHCGDAVNLANIAAGHGFEQVDVVVSGIPFSALPAIKANEIASGIDRVLRPGGTLIAYQLHDDIQQSVNPLFGMPQTNRVALNLPPLSVFSWTKPVVERTEQGN